MIRQLIAYDLNELAKRRMVGRSRTLYKSGVLREEQWQHVRSTCQNHFYSPNLFLKVLFFIFTFIGISTIMGPLGLLFDFESEVAVRIAACLVGSLLLLLTDRFLIAQQHHFRSGVTEAGLYVGALFLLGGVLGVDIESPYPYLLVALAASIAMAIRYLDMIALLLAFLFFGWTLFQALMDLGGVFEAIIPFVFMTVFGVVYFITAKREAKTDALFRNFFLLIKSLSLVIVYVAGNYFVVRELSMELMGLDLAEGQDIPFAILFYTFTVLIPILYLVWGLRQRSILHIRVSMLTIALSVLTFKYYFLPEHHMVSVTAAGAVLMVLAVLLFRHLRRKQGPYTSEKLITDKWSNPDLMALIASQTLGGHKLQSGNESQFGGGSFGGGGAGDNW